MCDHQIALEYSFKRRGTNATLVCMSLKRIKTTFKTLESQTLRNTCGLCMIINGNCQGIC